MVRQLVGPESEPVYSTYFTRRLEAFNDVVFGFSLSLLASQLEPSNFAHTERFLFSLFIFFATFALLASIWYAHYLTFHYGFAGKNVDVLLNFALLAGAALVPFTFQLTVAPADSAQAARAAFIPYAADFAGVYTINAILKLRGLKAFGDRLEQAAQRKIFRSAMVSAAVLPAMTLSVIVTQYKGPVGYVGFMILAIVGAVTRRMKAVPPQFLPAPAA